MLLSEEQYRYIWDWVDDVLHFWPNTYRGHDFPLWRPFEIPVKHMVYGFENMKEEHTDVMDDLIDQAFLENPPCPVCCKIVQCFGAFRPSDRITRKLVNKKIWFFDSLKKPDAIASGFWVQIKNTFCIWNFNIFFYGAKFKNGFRSKRLPAFSDCHFARRFFVASIHSQGSDNSLSL